MPRLLIGNLDCEVTWAGAAGRPLPERVAVRASEAALEMAALAGKGDRLWTPRPLAREVPGVELVSGPLEKLDAPEAVLAWGETEAVAALRERGRLERRSAEGGRVNEGAVVGPAAGVSEALWRLHPRPDVARVCNDRALSFSLAEARGWALPGARWIRTLEELREHLAAGGAGAGHGGAWVVKAPLAAAGRERLRRHGPELDPEGATRAGRLLERYGRLLFEPWVERIDDLGRCGLIGPGGVRLLPAHRQSVDKTGVVRAVELCAPEDWRPGEIEPLERAAEAAGEALRARGYRGPFVVDAFRYRDADGRTRWQPMSEINARLSFGLLTHAIAERRRLRRHRLEL